MISVCAGAFALAHAGLLDGRRATTHWGWAAELAARFPRVEVDPAALYVDEGEVMTSAGLSAGIDLCLHVVRKDFGAAVGDRVARRMVAAPHRDGGQAQFIERPVARATPARWSRPAAGRSSASDEPLDVAAMARHAASARAPSPAASARRPGRRRCSGCSPSACIEARRLLEETDLPIEEIAWRAGFGTAASLRDHFRRATATSPTAYRRTFTPLAA